jgi:CDP-glucose 4,6-dehydratase
VDLNVLDETIARSAARPFGGAFAGRRALVTGHTGFKGSWLAFWLAQLDAHVIGAALAPADDQRLFGQLNLPDLLSEDRRVDVRDAAAVAEAVRRAEPDFVFHLAAQPLVRESYQDPAATFAANVQGVVHVLDAVRRLDRPCTVVVVTTDKCYENQDCRQGYAEEDRLGGHDPYSASKACAELVAASYRRSFFAAGQHIRLATARAGNVSGGGDLARDRILPDAIRALRRGQPIPVRNKTATRPWQHVLEPLSGYLWLAAAMSAPDLRGAADAATFCDAFNFGPALEDGRTVAALVEEVLRHAPGGWRDASDPHAAHEAARLHLAIDKADRVLGWRPVWNFADTVRRTVEWYAAEERGVDLPAFTREQIAAYAHDAHHVGVAWMP